MPSNKNAATGACGFIDASYGSLMVAEAYTLLRFFAKS
jgi:hypothetical protein